VAKSGPPKTPSAILEKRGSWRINDRKDEPLPDELPADYVPDYLNDEEKAEWDYIYPKLHKLGIMTELDATMLAVYCMTLRRYKDAIRMAHTTHAELKTYVAQLMQISARFGMSPADRAALKVPQKPKEKKDDIAKYFKVS
jgi:phage terminase small subunit